MAKYFHANANQYDSYESLTEAMCSALDVNQTVVLNLVNSSDYSSAKTFIITDDGRFPRYCAGSGGIYNINSIGNAVAVSADGYKLSTLKSYNVDGTFYIVPYCDGVTAPYTDLFVPPFSGVTNYQLLIIGDESYRYYNYVSSTLLFKITT